MTDEQAVVPVPKQPDPRPDIIAGARVLPLVPRNIDEVLRYSKMLLVAGAVPESLTKEKGRDLPEKEVVARVVAVISAGSEVGMGPMSAMANIALINQRRYIWGQGAIGLIQASGALEEMAVEKIGAAPDNKTPTAQFADDFGIKVTLKRRGQAQAYVGLYTVGMAKRAHLWMNTNKKPWIESPERQLYWRAFHIAAVDGFADCLSGLGIRELAEEPRPVPRITDTSFLDAGPVRPTPVREPGAPDEPVEPEEEPVEEEENGDETGRD